MALILVHSELNTDSKNGFDIVGREGLDRKPILFRCDGTAATGLGHVSRCLALAEALIERGYSCRFLGRFEAGAAELLYRAGVASSDGVGGTRGYDIQNSTEAVRDSRAAAVVIDSYSVNDAYITALDRGAAPVLLIDDFGKLERYECSALLNFTVNAVHIDYPPRNQLRLIGPEYLLVRRRLRQLRRKMRPRVGDVRRLLIAMGGADPLDVSRRVVRILVKIVPNLSVRVVVGRSYEYTNELSLLVAGFRRAGDVAVQLADLADEFAWADMCVCGGGLTKYEAAYMGVPTAVLSQNAEQARETVHFAGKGLALDLGLVTTRNDTSLATRLFELIVNRDLRESLSRMSLAFFPEDPTRRAADVFARMVNGTSW